MKRSLPYIRLALSALLATTSMAVVFVAMNAHRNAHDTLMRAERLYQARLEVADAQEKLGESDVEEAARAARAANATARRVGDVTAKIVRLLAPTEAVAKKTLSSARRGARRAVIARRQTDVAAAILGAIAGYQGAATHSSEITNRALERILRALRETNEQFP